MPGVAVSENLRWVRCRSVGAAAASAPVHSGIYAYCDVVELHGLPIDVSWVYVGQAKRLESRLQQHSVGREKNPGLRDWLHRAGCREVWFAAVPELDLDKVERDLIVRLQPRLNRVLYAKHASPIPGAIPLRGSNLKEQANA